MIGITDLDYSIISELEKHKELSLGYLFAVIEFSNEFILKSTEKLIQKNISCDFH